MMSKGTVIKKEGNIITIDTSPAIRTRKGEDGEIKTGGAWSNTHIPEPGTVVRMNWRLR